MVYPQMKNNKYFVILNIQLKNKVCGAYIKQNKYYNIK